MNGMQIEHQCDSLTILSDLHIGHALSLVRHPWQMRPLLDESRMIVFNGDTFEQRLPELKARSVEIKETLKAQAAAAGCEVVFIAGNHDPFVSDVRAVFLQQGSIFVTHGHALFDEITPWSNRAKQLAQRTRELHGLEGNLDDPLECLTGLERRLAIATTVSSETHAEDHLSDAPLSLKVVNYLSEFLHPARPFIVLKCWADTPRAADVFAETYLAGCGVKFIIIGHTHFRGVWRVGNRVVINTGSFALPLWRYGVRIRQGVLEVVEVRRRGECFKFGRKLHHFTLDNGFELELEGERKRV